MSTIGRYWLEDQWLPVLEACSKQAIKCGLATPATFRRLIELYSRSLRRRKAQNRVPLGLPAFGLLVTLAACGGQAAAPTPTAPPSPTLVASLTSTVAPTSVMQEKTPAAGTTPGALTQTPIVVTVEPLLGESVEPPLDITLPEGWRTVGYDTLLLTDVDAMRPVPLAVWSGPVTGGTGTIVLLWGFPSLVGGNPLEAQAQTPSPDLWADGLRLLRLAVLEQGCNIGTDLRRDYRIGLLAAVGTQFSAVDCPEQMPDTRGWFAGVNERGMNFVFYVFADPIDAMTQADEELQAILDTVRFRVLE